MSSSWKSQLELGLVAFRASKFDNALENFNKAITLGAQGHLVYDSRAATFEKLGRIADALRDTRKVIQMSPQAVQGYMRAARLFTLSNKHDQALTMIKLAMERLQPADTSRKAQLDLLVKQISVARHAYNTSITCYISKLPVELLCHIFLLCTANRSSMAIVIASICKHWRAITVSLPSAWQSLVITKNKPTSKVSLWTRRAKYKIRKVSIRSHIPQHQLSDAIEELSLCKDNFCRTFRIEVNNIQVLDTLCAGLNKNFATSLNELVVMSEVAIAMGTLQPFLPSKLNSEYRSPIQCLTLQRITIDWQLVLPHFHNLIQFVLLDISSHAFPDPSLLLQIFRQSPNIKVIGLGYSGLSLPSILSTPAERLELAHLTHFQAAGPGRFRELISYLSMPNLRTLDLARLFMPAEILLLALEPCTAPISELRIQTCNFLETSISGLLHQWNRIKTLEISKTSSDVSLVIEGLAVEGVCPLLEYANFSYCTAVRTGSIVRLLKSRLTTTAREGDKAGNQDDLPSFSTLQTLIIDGCPQIDSEVLPWIRTKVRTVSCIYQTKEDVRNRKPALF